VVNSLYSAAPSGLKAEATQYALDGSVLRTKTQPIGKLGADGVMKLFPLPNIYPAPTPPLLADCVEVAGTDTKEDEYQSRFRCSCWGSFCTLLRPDQTEIHHTSVLSGTDPRATSRYKSAKSESATQCGKLCVQDAQCTHAVQNSRDLCFLKNMKQNDFGDTMTPIQSDGCTLLLKRYLKPTTAAASSASSASATSTGASAAVARNGTLLLRLRLTDEAEKVVEENW
jgi:hypothetical protein